MNAVDKYTLLSGLNPDKAKCEIAWLLNSRKGYHWYFVVWITLN